MSVVTGYLAGTTLAAWAMQHVLCQHTATSTPLSPPVMTAALSLLLPLLLAVSVHSQRGANVENRYIIKYHNIILISNTII